MQIIWQDRESLWSDSRSNLFDQQLARWASNFGHFWPTVIITSIKGQTERKLTEQVQATHTSGWNCCSVRLWQYWQVSLCSHKVGSPHSSPCFTLGQGVELREREHIPEYRPTIHKYATEKELFNICKGTLWNDLNKAILHLANVPLQETNIWLVP